MGLTHLFFLCYFLLLNWASSTCVVTGYHSLVIIKSSFSSLVKKKKKKKNLGESWDRTPERWEREATYGALTIWPRH